MTLRVGFLGAGLIATFHSKMLRASGEAVEWAGVFDPDRHRAEAFATASGATPCATEDEVLDGCDAVYVCTWTSEHRRLVEAAAGRGLAVFCEKPLATNLDDARAMARCVEDAGVPNQVGLVLRRSPAFALARHLVAAPDAGRLVSIVFRDDQHIPIRGAYRSSWRADRSKAGAGTLLEHSIHDVDLLEWIAGPAVAVSARTAHFHGLDGIEDLAVATLEFAGGAIGTLTSVWHDIDPRPSLRRVELFCERRWVSVEGDWWGPVRWTDADGTAGCHERDDLVAAVAALPEAGANPDGAFVRAVGSGQRCWPGLTVAVRAHEVVDALYRSAGDGGRRLALAG